MQEIFVYFFSRFSEYYGQFNSHSASSCGSSNFINDDICSFETFFFHVWVLGKKFFSLSFFFLTIAARLPEIVPSKNVSYTTIIFVLWMECFWLPGATALSGFGWWQCCVCVCVCLRTLMFILFIYVFASNEQCDIQEGWGYWTKLTEKHASCSLVPTPSFPFIIFGYMAWWTPVVAGPTRTGDRDDGAHRWF